MVIAWDNISKKQPDAFSKTIEPENYTRRGKFSEQTPKRRQRKRFKEIGFLLRKCNGLWDLVQKLAVHQF